MAFWTKDSQQNETSNLKTTAPGTSSPGDSKGPLVIQGKTASVPSTTVPTPATPTPSVASSSVADAQTDRFGKIRSALGPGTVIQGKLSFDTPVRIDGKLSGEVFSTDALIIGPSGSIDAQIEASHLIVMGVVKGTIKATKKIELLAGGRIESDVTTPALSMEEGSTFNGKCTMNSSAAAVALQSPQMDKPSAAKSTAAAPEKSPKVDPEPAKDKAVEIGTSLH